LKILEISRRQLVALLWALCYAPSGSGSAISERKLQPSTCITTTIYYNRFTALCPGLPGWAGTRRNIHPLTPIQIINHPLSASSIYYDPQHPPCSIYVPDSLFYYAINTFETFIFVTSFRKHG